MTGGLACDKGAEAAANRAGRGGDDGTVAHALRDAAPAKLNLTLEILGRRADGYHELASLVAFADAGDVLLLHPHAGADVSIEASGPFADAIDGENLVLRAARCFLQANREAQGGHFCLEKRLPVASGVGGGSSDAAAGLRLLARANAPEQPAAEVLRPLIPALSRLGADIAVCLHARAAWMTGIGERVAPLPALPEAYAVLANPGVALATRAVFAALGTPPAAGRAAPAPLPPAFAVLGDLVGYMRARSNDLEPPARAIAPVIAQALDALAAAPGCRIARLSGSGATCFGIFETRAQAEAAARAIARSHPDWWIAPARLS